MQHGGLVGRDWDGNVGLESDGFKAPSSMSDDRKGSSKFQQLRVEGKLKDGLILVSRHYVLYDKWLSCVPDELLEPIEHLSSRDPATSTGSGAGLTLSKSTAFVAEHFHQTA